MNDASLIAMAIISTLGMLAGIELINHNWFKREKVKYQYQVRRAKLKQKGVSVAKNPPSGALDWIDTIKKLNPDTMHALIDQFAGEGMEIQEGGDITGTLINLAEQNPELVQSFLKGLGGKKQEEKQDLQPQM